jgi:hypothetical protein
VTIERIHVVLNTVIIVLCVVVVAMVAASCATIEQTRINSDGSSYTAKGKVILKGSIAELKTALTESIDDDGTYTLDIGQESATLDADAIELVSLLNNLLGLIKPIP